MISQKSIQEILEVAKVEDIVGEYVNLRRRGVNMIGLCPFHNEKTPSFTVSPQKNIYKCFGCGESGGVITFLMESEQMSYPEALRHLAKKYNIELEETQTSDENRKERQLLDSLFIINEFAKDYYQKQLLETDLGKSIGLSYFKQRGFREETIQKFGLGFAPNKKNLFTLHAVNKGYNIDLLKKVGLTSQYGSDFFRGRVMFPIRNLSGKVIGFGGRILDKNAKTAKYMNTPESEIYNKSKVLYGAYEAKKGIRKQDECIMVEGYTDVISLHQGGIDNVVASSGTSLTVGQIQLIRRYTPNMKIIYDGDAAGIKAALRGLDLVLEQDMNVKVVLLPDGEDPDSYLKKVGTTAFKQFIDENANDFIIFKTNLLLKETKNDPIRRANLIKDIIESIGKIPDPIKRSVFIRACSQLLETDEQILVTETNKVVQKLINKKRYGNKTNVTSFKPQPTPPSTPNFPTSPFGPPLDSFPTDIAPPDFQGFPPDLQGFPTTQQQQQLPTTSSTQKKPTTTDEFQEKDIVRILIEFGEQFIEDEVSVAQYVLANMEEIIDDFDNALYGKITKEIYQTFLEEERILSLQYFLTHQEKDIQKTAINLTTFPYDYSENWEKKFEKPLQTQPMPELNFKQDAINGVNNFKLRKVIRLYKKNQKRLKDLPSSNFEEMMRILKVQKKLGELRGKLAALTKTVVLE